MSRKQSRTAYISYPTKTRIRHLRLHLHGTKSVWNQYKIGADKHCVYTGPGTYESDPLLNFAIRECGTETV